MTTPLIIICLLISPLILAWFYTKLKGTAFDIHYYAFWGLGIAFIYFSLGHVAKTAGMVEMLPPWVPGRLPLVYLTGLLELAIGIALFVRPYQVLAAKLAIVVLIVFFPANIYAAFNHIGLGGHQWGPEYLFIRAPLQIFLLAWAYFFCVRKRQ